MGTWGENESLGALPKRVIKGCSDAHSFGGDRSPLNIITREKMICVNSTKIADPLSMQIEPRSKAGVSFLYYENFADFAPNRGEYIHVDEYDKNPAIPFDKKSSGAIIELERGLMMVMIALRLKPGFLLCNIDGMKPVVMKKEEYRLYPEIGSETVSGTDVLTGRPIEVLTKYLQPINHHNN